MAQFRGLVSGKAGTTASRLGSKNSGLIVRAQSWEGEVQVELWNDPATGCDVVRIDAAEHGGNKARCLYRGPVAEARLPIVPLTRPADHVAAARELGMAVAGDEP